MGWGSQKEAEFLSAQQAVNAYPDPKFSLLEPVTPFRRDTHRNKFEARGWTDDTDQAFLIILSYIHNKGKLIPDDFASRLRNWCSQGLRCLDRLPLGIGRTVGSTALAPSYLSSPQTVAIENWIKTGRQKAANGSLMRTHPLGAICVPLSLQETFQAAANFSRTTHADPRCVVSCCAATGAIRGILRGEILTEQDLNDMLQKAFDFVVGDEHLLYPGGDADKKLAAVEAREPIDRDEYLRHTRVQNLQELELDDSMKMGYVYKCLGAAVVCLRFAMRTSDPVSAIDLFESLITELVMCGGDADTNACVAGAFLGAWLGYARLPKQWAGGIAHRDWLVDKALRLCGLAGISLYANEGSDDPDAAPDGGKGFLNNEELEKRGRDLISKVLNMEKERLEEEKRTVNQAGLGSWFKDLSRRGKTK